MQNIIAAVEPVGRMPAFGTTHLVMVALTVIATIAIVPAARSLRRRHRDRAVTRVSGWALLVVTAVWTAFWLLPANFDLQQSLPLHFSDALRFITAIALITRAGWAIMISYLWGLTLNAQSLLTPDLSYFAYPALEFSAYWFLHMVNWLVPIALVWGLGYRPTWRGFAVAYAVAAAWTGLGFAVNVFAGTNYGYSMHAPTGGSALDYFGPWPWYALTVAVLLAVAWALLTWPWTTARFVRRSEPAGLVRVASST